ELSRRHIQKLNGLPIRRSNSKQRSVRRKSRVLAREFGKALHFTAGSPVNDGVAGSVAHHQQVFAAIDEADGPQSKNGVGRSGQESTAGDVPLADRAMAV